MGSAVTFSIAKVPMMVMLPLSAHQVLQDSMTVTDISVKLRQAAAAPELPPAVYEALLRRARLVRCGAGLDIPSGDI